MNKQPFEFLHAFSHEHCIVFTAADQTLAARIRQFTSELLATMAQTTKVFRLRVKGVAALSKPLVAELASCLGELIEVKMNGNTVDNYVTLTLRSSPSAKPSTGNSRAPCTFGRMGSTLKPSSLWPLSVWRVELSQR